jgi:hypothetical protein
VKVSFLCPTVDPGRDGVGDYVMQFARALTERGHRCQIVALADRLARGPSRGAINGVACEVVRQPARDWAAGRIDLARDALARFAPDWSSLQMVCYGYESRGVLLRSVGRLRALRGAGRRHVMFHELWIGETAGAGLRERSVGWLQRRSVLAAIRAWAPSLMHTSNPTYVHLLGRAGLAAEELPLPGGVQVLDGPSATRRVEILRQRLRAELQIGEASFLAGVFGSIHAGWELRAWLQELRAACRESGRFPVLLQIGRAGAAGERVWSDLRARQGAGVRFAELGEMSAEDVSACMQLLDLGVATTPWPLIGKSSSVAAMLEHGLPVVVPREDYRLRRGETPEPTPHPLLLRFDPDFLAAVRAGGPARRPPLARQDMYDRLLACLAGSAEPLPQVVAGAAPAAVGGGTA